MFDKNTLSPEIDLTKPLENVRARVGSGGSAGRALLLKEHDRTEFRLAAND